MLAFLDIFDPSSYPRRRDEEWKYSDLSRVLRVVPAADRVSHGRDRLDVPAGENAVRFDTYRDVAEVTHEDLEITLGEGASLVRVVILDEPAEAVSIRRSTVKTAPNSRFKQYVFSTGAMFQRFETHVAHAGHGAEVELNGAYLLKDKAHFDLTTRVVHGEIGGATAQLVKGLVRDTATGVFQGRILVERGADGTDARMRHQALILNDGAHIRAKPELEIYADDVQCAHGNTIGALDEEALFFCESRGIPEAAARALLTQAFVMPVADLIEDEALREKVTEFLNAHTEAFHGL
jgi:Fe-S cluster assembly protein SufD